MLQIANHKNKDIFISILIFSILTLCLTLPIEKSINPKISEETLFITSRFKIWIGLILIYLYVIKVQKQNFFLWNETKYSVTQSLKSIFLTLLSIAVAMLLFGIIIKISNTDVSSKKLNIIIKLLKNNFGLLFFVCLTAGITEEILFRGFLLPRLAMILKNHQLAILLSSFFFGILHFSYGTLAQIIGPIIIGTVFAFHYYKYRNIRILIICHFVWDFLVLMIKTKI